MPRQTIKPPAPGLYENIPEAEYHAWDAVSSTVLKQMLIAPAMCAHYLAGDDEARTPSMIFGSAVHRIALEPDRIRTEYVRRPDDLDRRTKAGKEEWANLCERFGEDRILHADDVDRLKGIVGSIASHPSASKLLYSSAVVFREVSLVWNDAETGLWCKARIDALCAGELLVDLKTTSDSADPDHFGRIIERYRYHVQATHYMRGWEAIRPLSNPGFVFIPVETSAPYLCSAVQLGRRSLDAGTNLWRRAMREYAECMRTGKWPGYSGEVVSVDIPAWAAEATADIEEEMAAEVGGAL